MLSNEERELWDDAADEIIEDLKVLRSFNVSMNMGSASPLLSSMYVTTTEERGKLARAVVTTREGAKRLKEAEDAWVWGPRRLASKQFRAMVLATAVEESDYGLDVNFAGVRQLDVTIGANRFVVEHQTRHIIATSLRTSLGDVEEWWYALTWEVGSPLEASLLRDTRVDDGPLSESYGDGEAMQFWELLLSTTGLDGLHP